MNIWHDIQPELVRQEAYTVVVSNSMGSTAMLALDTATGLLRLERVNDATIGASHNTGFVPRTCTAQGRPVDTILLCSAPLPPMTLVTCRPVGMIVVRAENGMERHLVLSAATADEFWSGCMTVGEIPSSNRKALVRWLRYDLQLAGEASASIEFENLEQTELFLDRCIQEYLLRYCGKRLQES